MLQNKTKIITREILSQLKPPESWVYYNNQTRPLTQQKADSAAAAATNVLCLDGSTLPQAGKGVVNLGMQLYNTAYSIFYYLFSFFICRVHMVYFSVCRALGVTCKHCCRTSGVHVQLALVQSAHGSPNPN